MTVRILNTLHFIVIHSTLNTYPFFNTCIYFLVDSMKEITFKQALPIIVFPKYQTLQFLAGLYEAKIRNGRFIFGTQFYTIPQDIPQMFLCPNKEAPNRCLKPVVFKESDILECQLEPEPLLIEDEEMKTCGPDGTYTRLQFVYKVNLPVNSKLYPHI